MLEITLVSPPYVIDFGKSYLDHPPEHSPETLAEHEADQIELWGEKIGEVNAILWRLERMGIYYTDATPRNISFPPDSD
ncbi:hypothetical protein [Botrimarina sp.]|uniref:hypothetical protein n=1 Tax=Botrimarina sp. TaxID=2795802 RepID=UPI0032EB6548